MLLIKISFKISQERTTAGENVGLGWVDSDAADVV